MRRLSVEFQLTTCCQQQVHCHHFNWLDGAVEAHTQIHNTGRHLSVAANHAAKDFARITVKPGDTFHSTSRVGSTKLQWPLKSTTRKQSITGRCTTWKKTRCPGSTSSELHCLTSAMTQSSKRSQADLILPPPRSFQMGHKGKNWSSTVEQNSL